MNYFNLPASLEKKPRIIFPLGLPGCGKSTWIAHYIELNADRKTVIISSDNQIEEYAAQNNLNYTTAFSKLDSRDLQANMDASLRKAIFEGADVVVDRTNLRIYARRRWLSQTPKKYVKICVRFDVPHEVIKERLIVREKQTGKYIPENVWKNMAETIQYPETNEFDYIKVIYN